ncbi:hypothetical protein GSI_06784 [Ganoderma sinense ZZ0214-1]|uniref:C2H2-type domain-containing protein n=1 Tax=Ganoderma sinense ZZ0214-1 TaxID=1077348 RepID=A0A2G8SE99_9APHY|nr:hypothetical protein GSI_06784 [Ganoderma sinense ZZ0214-1]
MAILAEHSWYAPVTPSFGHRPSSSLVHCAVMLKFRYQCSYCQKSRFLSRAGLRSHITQTPDCRQAQRLEWEHTRAALPDSSGEQGGTAGGNPALDAPADPDISMQEENQDPAAGDWNMDDSDAPSRNQQGADPPAPHPVAGPGRVTVEEVEDEEPGGLPKRPWIGEFPRAVASILRKAKTIFEELRDSKRSKREDNFAPFANREEWELAAFLMRSGMSQEQIEDYLTLPITRTRTAPSFRNKRSFMQKIDALPAGVSWLCDQWELVGDLVDEEGDVRTEEIELWRRDPVELVRELLGNPIFRDSLRYAPEQLFANEDGSARIYDETWTGDWWWELQGLLPPGVTIAPIILSSDKTVLSRFSGDKQAWPVYLTIGNISKSVRRQPSMHATILLGYIPYTKLDCFTKSRRALESYRLFHECMRTLLAPLVAAGKEGVEMVCADGAVRRVHPILAAYIADHPEQCLVTGCQENFCPKCSVHSTQLGEPIYSTMKDQDVVWDTIQAAARGEKPNEFKDLGLRLIDPFWRDLPHCDIFACITPDLLHQLHKGVFKDHTVSWATACVDGGADEVDRRFKAMPSHPMLRHFKKGISLVTQWTGTEYKHMERVFLGVLSGASDPASVRAVRAVLDFIYYAHFHAHADDSLSLLEAAWVTFHENKYIFVNEGIREHYNIPKLHSALHYPLSIRKLGTTDGYNTENTERLHIDYAKRGYAASNKKEYIKQMTVWLRRQEAVSRFHSYLAWAEPLRTSTTNPIPDEDADDGDVSMVEKPDTVPPYVLAKTPGLPGTSVHKLVHQFGCTDFIRALVDFLRRKSSSRTLPVPAQHLSRHTRFAVYKRMHVYLPPLRQVSAVPIKDVIRAVPAQPARGLIHASPAHFDTVLIRETPPAPDSRNPLEGLRVARVRAIFRIPEHYGPEYREPVAFVEWFTPFRPEPDSDTVKLSVVAT